MFNLFKKTKSPTNSQTVTLKINGMHCVACSLNIDTDLEDLPGIISSSTSYPKSQTTVTFDPLKVDLESIKIAISKTGYTASQE